MFGPFRRKPKPAKPVPPFKVSEETRNMIVILIAGGMSFEEVLGLYPELNEAQLKAVVKGAVSKLPMFPE